MLFLPCLPFAELRDSCFSIFIFIIFYMGLLVYARELTGTFFCVTKATLSLPRTAMLVIPSAFTALNAYSEEQTSI